MSNFFDTITKRRADAIAELDEKTFAPLIRNHLVQLFRNAQAKDKGLKGVLCGMGTAIPHGIYSTHYDEADGGEALKEEARNWSMRPDFPEVSEFFDAVAAYSDEYMNLPDIGDITPADLETRGGKKAKIHSPKGLRDRLNR